MNTVSSTPALAPVIPLLSQRRHLATYGNAYAVALRLKETTGADQYVVSTHDIQQPFRVLSDAPSDVRTIVSLIA